MIMVGFPIERFLAKADKQEDHWLWTGAKGGSSKTYGVFTWVAGPEEQYTKMAHVWSYLYFVGPIPQDYEVDHRCKIRLCVRPECLEAVTKEVNNIRKRKTHCKNGHELTPENVYVHPSTGSIHGCKKCRREAFLKWKGRGGDA